MSPERVPITSPSSGVIPIDVSTAAPPRIADTEAPVAEVQHDLVQLRRTGRSSTSATRCETKLCEVPWKP